MKILALDTSSRAASCAIMRDGVLAGEFFANIGLTHSQTAMPMVEAMLEQTKINLHEIDVFAVTTGPGSFTGLRIGVSCVKGMAAALNKPCAGVSTLLALAGGVSVFSGYICPVMDARREQVYTALFESTGGQTLRKREDEALPLSELKTVLAALAPTPVLLAGDGGSLAFGTLGDLGHVSLAPERILHQRASVVAQIAGQMAVDGQLVSPGGLAPGYLRLPQAERERLEAINQ
ncbi:MAG: tRNA (adenosine(37)-N6)-threonylcarbamoyltransferase complex dimerization subunit type 1 TsaB [Oscillospiraceae bacterium]|nr:tRNA (adenosine(37)-N6)-threonylcarbamoyltransferase complex dimerization subunit type 1 TsaB [Oscillospiraceae bacterium]